MGDVDELHDTFPVVGRDVIKTLYEHLSDPSPANLARALEKAAEKGHVPDRDYFRMAREKGGVELLEIDLDDPLNEPPEADPASPANAARGEQALRWAEENAIDKRAKRLAKAGTVDELLDFLVTVDRWGNEALLAPNRASLPDRFDVAINRTMDGLQSALEELAHQGDAAALDRARDAIQALPNQELSRALTDELEALQSLLDGSGAEYEAARAYVLDEDLTPIECATRADTVHHRFDITVEQYEELVEDATALLEEAQAAMESQA